MAMNPADRFWSKVDKNGPAHPVLGTPCWLWKASKNNGGYGTFRAYTSKTVGAHRWAYEEERGPVPTDMELDHLCRTRCCVNPAHLEPVTKRENGIRGTSLIMEQAKRTHCPQGHPYDAQNTYIYKGLRYCRICRKDHRKALAAKRRKLTIATPRRVIRGEETHGAKLTSSNALEIYNRRLAGEPGSLLAKEFGVSQATVSYIFHKKTWRHVVSPSETMETVGEMAAGGAK
jgi:hypothetical protein